MIAGLRLEWSRLNLNKDLFTNLIYYYTYPTHSIINSLRINPNAIDFSVMKYKQCSTQLLAL